MIRLLVCLAVLTVVGVQDLSAQCRTRGNRTECRDRSRTWVVVHERTEDRAAQFGVRGGYDFDAEAGSAGAQFRVPVVSQLLVLPSADVYFGSGGAEWQLNADLALRPDDLAGLYGGIGAALLNRDPDPDDLDDDDGTQVGFNLFVGMESGRIRGTRVRPFVEARWTGVNDDFPFRLVAGFNVPISAGR